MTCVLDVRKQQLYWHTLSWVATRVIITRPARGLAPREGPAERRRTHKVGCIYQVYIRKNTGDVRLHPPLLPSTGSMIVGGYQVRAK